MDQQKKSKWGEMWKIILTVWLLGAATVLIWATVQGSTAAVAVTSSIVTVLLIGVGVVITYFAGDAGRRRDMTQTNNEIASQVRILSGIGQATVSQNKALAQQMLLQLQPGDSPAVQIEEGIFRELESVDRQ